MRTGIRLPRCVLAFFNFPRWKDTRAHVWQRGGGLFIKGMATLTNANVYTNQAGVNDVCSPLNVELQRPDSNLYQNEPLHGWAGCLRNLE